MSKNPQKIIEGRYQVVPRSIILLIREGQVLLQKAPVTKKLFPGYYNGIGGHIERGEDVLSAARRELKEEAGISSCDLHLSGTISIDVHDEEGILLFVFTGDEISGDIVPSEEGTLHWVDIDQLSRLEVVEDVPELVERILHHKETGQLFFGTYTYDDEGRRITSWLTS